MARSYPRFLYSNPKNTKSKGPFIVHTLEPRFIAKVEIIERPHLFHVEMIENWDFPGDPAEEIIGDAAIWLKTQIQSGEIKL